MLGLYRRDWFADPEADSIILGKKPYMYKKPNEKSDYCA